MSLTVHDGKGMFQSAPPAKGATGLRAEEINSRQVSIRAPREGGDRHRQRAAA